MPHGMHQRDLSVAEGKPKWINSCTGYALSRWIDGGSVDIYRVQEFLKED